MDHDLEAEEEIPFLDARGDYQRLSFEEGNSLDASDDDERYPGNSGFVSEEVLTDSESSSDLTVTTTSSTAQRSSWCLPLQYVLHVNLIPDSDGISIGSVQLVEGMFAVKFLKFLLITYFFIGVVHSLVPFVTDDRDRDLQLWQIWVFDGNLIAMDTMIFFVVGRLWKQRGIDHLAWIGWVVVCNLYFEGQQFFPFLQHSTTLYEMHCRKFSQELLCCKIALDYQYHVYCGAPVFRPVEMRVPVVVLRYHLVKIC